LERYVDGKVFPRATTVVLELSGARKEVMLVLVKGDSHNSVCVPECEFDAISVVNIDVDV
jgi:hypothetical protein